jgi:hypothetical protein
MHESFSVDRSRFYPIVAELNNRERRERGQDHFPKFIAIRTMSLMSTVLSLLMSAAEFHLGLPGLEARANSFIPQVLGPAASAAQCPGCSGSLGYVSQYGRWYCDQCRRYARIDRSLLCKI